MTSVLPRVLALAPTGLLDPAPVVAGSRAGALGVLDPGPNPGPDVGPTLAALQRVARFLDRPFGVRLPTLGTSSAWLERAPVGLAAVIGTEGDTAPSVADWAAFVEEVRRSGRLAVAEVTSRASALAAGRAGADALVVVGHEAGGRVGDESSFILLQAVLGLDGPPVWVRGGIGPKSAAACVAGGAAGVVLDGALLLARESPLPGPIRDRVARWDGSETTVVRRPDGPPVRLHLPAGSAVGAALRATTGAGGTGSAASLAGAIGWRIDGAWPVGQDAALASSLARRYVTVGGIVRAVEEAIDEGPAAPVALRPLAEGSPLAASHGTRYPIVQGPMTRVSDRPPSPGGRRRRRPAVPGVGPDARAGGRASCRGPRRWRAALGGRPAGLRPARAPARSRSRAIREVATASSP